MTNKDLFKAGPAGWEADPQTSFDTWLSQQKGRGGAPAMRISSAEVYRAQWGKFLDYLQTRGVELTRVTDVHISEFLSSLHSENRSQRDRYRKLIERVFADLYRSKAPRGYVNPAGVAQKEQGAAWKAVAGNLPTSFLTLAERRTLVEHLLSPVVWQKSEEHWRQLRDRAMVATFLGAGLKVSEALRLTVNCVALHGEPWIKLRRPDSQFSHRTQPTPFARDLLARWLAERATSGCRGDLVFPAGVHGGAMHSVTALRAADAIVDASGVSENRLERASPQTMRNSFAAGMFEAGESPKSVGESLGFAVVLTAERLKASWQSWQTFQN